MRILEVRDGFVKFEAESNTQLSSFIQIEGVEKKYVAQVIQLKRAGENPIGYAKILFLYDGALQSYDKTLPSKESQIHNFDMSILLDSINYNQPIVAGKILGTDSKIIVDTSVFDKKMLICTDDKNANNMFVRNLSKQFNNLEKKVIVIDTLGTLSAKKIIAGLDFKLPLDTNSLSFMYSDCLNDATGESKALIVEIFKDLAEYSKTVEFLPFLALKNIVDDMVDKSHVFKLLVLKNKLAKFDKLGYFAKNKTEVDAINKLFNEKCIIIDFSRLDVAFQNRYIEFIYEKLAKDLNVQVILELSNTISKKCLKNVLSSEVATTFISHSKFKYLTDIKNLFDNFILTPSIAINQIFTIFNTFLNSMSKDSYLVAGEGTNYIPLVSPLEKIDDVVSQEVKLEEYIQNSDNINAQDSSEAVVETEPTELSVTTEDVDNNLEELISDVSQEDSSHNLIVQNEEIESIEEPIVEPILTEEEILSTIDEKSQDVISKVSEDASIPEKMRMFDADDESEDEQAVIEENIDLEFSEPIDDNAIVESHINSEFQEEYLKELDVENGSIEEIPISDSFSTEVHSDAIVENYVEPDNSADNSFDEITINDELNMESEQELDQTIQQSDEIDIKEEDNSILLDNDIDLDIESTEEFLQEQDANSNVDLYNSDDSFQTESNEINVMPIDSNNIEGLDEIVELNPDDIDENDIVVDITEEDSVLPENLDEQIVKDVDKVFTTRKDDDISDSDLDFIDELNSDGNEILEEVPVEDNLLEEIAESDEENSGILDNIEPESLKPDYNSDDSEILETRTSSTPIVPVYDADIPQEDLVESDPIQQGDSVTHAKYGSGVVEKMIKYGNKTLYSINFDNIGRRLLDPTLTEIKKS